jgi:hypothetical protein
MSIEAMKRAMDALKVAENSTEYMHLGEYFAEIRKELCQATEQTESKSAADCDSPSWCNHYSRCHRSVVDAPTLANCMKGQEPVAWAATSEDGVVEALGFNKSRRFDTPLYFAPDMSTKPENIDTSAECVHENDKSIHDFKPDWDMIAPFHERIKELEIENEKLRQALAQHEQEPLAVLKVWDEKEQKHVLMNYYITPPPKREIDMSTKPENIDTSEERVHETDKSVHDDEDIQEYKRPWVGLTEEEVHKIIDDCTPDEAEIEELIDFSIAILAVEAKLKERNT